MHFYNNKVVAIWPFEKVLKLFALLLNKHFRMLVLSVTSPLSNLLERGWGEVIFQFRVINPFPFRTFAAQQKKRVWRNW